jgi:hypothetical protein
MSQLERLAAVALAILALDIALTIAACRSAISTPPPTAPITTHLGVKHDPK